MTTPYAHAPRVTEFWSLVDQSGGPDACHPWTGYVNEDGYGAFYYDDRMRGAHELAVTLTTGERRLPDMDTCHSRECTTRLCCNRRHLRFDTRAANVADMVAMGRNHRFPARLTDEQVQLIRRRRAAGAAQDDLAEQYGCSASYISQIVNGAKRAAAGGPIATNRVYNRRTA